MGTSAAPADSGATSWIQLIPVMLGERHSSRTPCCARRGARGNRVGFRRMRPPVLTLVLVAGVLGLAAAAVAIQRWHRPAAPVAKIITRVPEREGGEDVVARALRLASIDPKHKDQWVDDIPDLDLAALAPGARATFLRVANGRRCDCGCGFT